MRRKPKPRYIPTQRDWDTAHIYSFHKASEGGPGQSWVLSMLRAAGIHAQPATSIYEAHTAVRVFGNKRVQACAARILFGGR